MLQKSKSNRDLFAITSRHHDAATTSQDNKQQKMKKTRSAGSGRDLSRRAPSTSDLHHASATATTTTTTSTTAASSELFFAGLVIHLVRRGIGSVQYNVLCQRIQEKGGTVASSFSEQVMVVVAATKVTHGELLQVLKLQDMPAHCRAHTLDWLTESLRWKRCLTAKEFALVPCSAKTRSPITAVMPPLTTAEDRSNQSYSPTAMPSSPIQQSSGSFVAPSAAFLAALQSKTELRPGSSSGASSPQASKPKGQRTSTSKADHRSVLATVTPSFEWCPDDFDGQNSGEEDSKIEVSKDEDSFIIRKEEQEGKGSEEDSEDTEVDEELQNYLKQGSKKRRTASSSDANGPISDPNKKPRLRRQRSKQKFNIFRMENNWLKYDSSEDDEENEKDDQAQDKPSEKGTVTKFSVYLGDSSLSLSTSQPSSPDSPDDKPSALDINDHYEEERRVTDDEEEVEELSTHYAPDSHRQRAEMRRNWVKGDPLFNPLFGGSGTKPRQPAPRPDCREPLLQAASARALGQKTHQRPAAPDSPLPFPTTSSSSLSPLRESPEREIYEEFSQLYDLESSATSRSNGEDQRETKESNTGRSCSQDEEDFTQHLSLAWDEPTTPTGQRKGTNISTQAEDSPSQFSISEFSPRHKRLSKRKQFFACQQSPGQSPVRANLNQHITDILEVMQKKSDASGDKWRSFAYRKAAAALKAHPKVITSEEEALRVRGIGKSIAEKIGEIIATGRLRKADATDEQAEVMALFSKIWGAGPETVKKWYARGYRTLEDLQNAKLSKPQQVGLRHYYNFQKRIPREEVRMLEKVVKREAKAISPHLKAVTCGSYRRGKADCGDVDILITHKQAAPLDGLLEQLLNRLHARSFLTDDLVRSSKKGDVYMGVCCIPTEVGGSGIHRRIDIRMIPRECWACALLYFTGSDHFNRSMRLWARRNGLSLSEKDLRPRYTEDIKGEPVPGLLTEEDVFKALGLDYKHPHERDV